MEETELDVLIPSSAEVEEIELSDVEDSVENEEPDVDPLNIDHNSRIILKKNTDLNAVDSGDARLFENNHSTFQSSQNDLFGDTSSEEIEVSDEEDEQSFETLTLQELSLDGIACVGTSRQFDSSSAFNYSSTAFKEQCLTDSEYISDDDMDDIVFKKSYKSPSDKRANTLSFGLSVSGLPASFKDALSRTSKTLSSLNVVNSFSNSILLKNNSLCDASDMQSPLMTCVEFLKADISEDEITDVEELSEELNDTTDVIYQPIINVSEPFQTNSQSGGGSVLDDALRCRGKGDFISSLDNSTRRSSWTMELLSEDESASGDSNLDAVKKRTKKHHRKRLSNGYANADECLTDEEVVDLDSKEWTETDESGSVRQITQIKTETSIKLEGDDAALDSDLVSTTTTTTSTRVVTSVISDPDLQSEIESTFVQQLSEDDIRQSCEITFNEVVKDNSTAKPEESEHDE